MGASASAAPNVGAKCLLPVTGYSQVAQDDGTYKVYLKYAKALEPNAKYTLVVEGDTNVNDSSVTGIAAASGVALGGVTSSTFTTGPSLCALDAVQISDTDKTSPYLFTRGDQMHNFVAKAVSHSATGPQEIVPIVNVYAWDYDKWVSGDAALFTALQSSVDHSTASIATVGKNGQTTILAEAIITADTLGGTKDKKTKGSAQVTALLCENPWPTLSKFPWQDNATGGAQGLASEGNGWMNFSTYFCRDQGAVGLTDDLPSVTPVRAPVGGTTNILKQYLFEIGDNSGDAIGVRIVSNPGYLSPRAWYDAQNFKGSPVNTTVDGFEAVRDGRTVYVSASNYSGGKLYSNIYVLSYNDGASASAQKIFDLMLGNISFAIDLGNDTVCLANGTLTDKTCSSDADCVSAAPGAVCLSTKAKVRRDVRRLSDLTDIRSAVKTYSTENSVCSGTRSKLCSTSAECPLGESCSPIVPELAAGTFVRNVAASTWPSWADILGGALGTKELPADPLNSFAGCGVVGSSLVSYDKTTCVDTTKGTYTCPAGSHVYQYLANGNSSTLINADLEFAGAWANSIDADGLQDGVQITVGRANSSTGGFSTGDVCQNTVLGTSTTCGDGVIGSGEVCEVGSIGGTEVACDGNADGIMDGFRKQICNSSCTGFVDNTQAACVAATCGNGVKDGIEQCDDGSKNGSYGFCGADCTRASGFSCGDGSLAGSEKCDCGNTPPLVGRRAFGGGTCGAINGVYQSNATTSCAWDCSGPAPYCGDKHLDSDEQCEVGEVKIISDALCVPSRVCEKGDIDKLGKICTIDSMCGTSGKCSVQMYPTSKFQTCSGTCQLSTVSTDCSATNLPSCGNGKIEGAETCDDGNLNDTDACTSSCKLNVCGDGALNPVAEECDLGVQNGGSCSSSYGSTCSACSTTCRNVVSSGAFCGDGVKNGTEYCDGTDVPYTFYDAETDTTSGTCSSLGQQLITSSHQVTTVSDSFDCGIATTQTCSGFGDTSCGQATGAIKNAGGKVKCVQNSNNQFVCAAYNLDGGNSSCNSFGEFCPAFTGTLPKTPTKCLLIRSSSVTTTVVDAGSTCSDVGVCNGGPRNGKKCTASYITLSHYYGDVADCEDQSAGLSYECVKPKCSASCASSCPLSLSDSSLLMTANQPGSRPSSSVDLYSYDAASTSTLPNATIITVPACTVSGRFSGSISLDNIVFPDAYVVFVTTRAASMGSVFGGTTTTKLSSTQDSLKGSVSTLFSELAAKAHVGLVEFGDTTSQSAMLDQTGESTLTTRINGYTVISGSDIGQGLLAAKTLLDTVTSPLSPTVRKIVVLLSDVAPTPTTSGFCGMDSLGNAYTSGDCNANTSSWSLKGANTQADKLDDYELYTIALSSSSKFISHMNQWSSNTGTEYSSSTGIDYSYAANTAVELRTAYERVINSIVGVTVRLLSTDSAGAHQDSVALRGGSSQTLPWPSGFKCDGSTTKQIPIQVTFRGTGQVKLSDVKINYCSP